MGRKFSQVVFVLGILGVIFLSLGCNPASDGDGTDDDNIGDDESPDDDLNSDDDSQDDDAIDDDGAADDDTLLRGDDLAVIRHYLTIELSNGDGSFVEAPLADPPYLYGFSSMSPGDFNSDGCLDLAATGAMPGPFFLLANDCDGTFTFRSEEMVDYYMRGGVFFTATADINHDGCLDIAVAASGDPEIDPRSALIIYLGDCAGGFAAGIERSLGHFPTGIAFGDFNNDECPDLVIGLGTNASIMLGDCEGNFNESYSLTEVEGYGYGSFLTADFNGDGNLDLLAAGGQSVYLCFGNGEGSMDTCKSVAPIGILGGLADFNGDAKLDFAMVEIDLQTVSVYLQKEGYEFEQISLFLCEVALSCAVGDFNGDGQADVAAGCNSQKNQLVLSQEQQVNILFGNGDGTFDDPIDAGFPADYLIAGQFDNK